MDNPFYSPEVSSDCKEYMLLSLRLWFKYIEKSDQPFPVKLVGTLNELLDEVEKHPDEIDIRDIAKTYKQFVDVFKEFPDVYNRLLRIPILFLIPEVKDEQS